MSFTIHWLSMMINSKLAHKLTMSSYKIVSAALSELEIFSEVQQAIVNRDGARSSLWLLRHA